MSQKMWWHTKLEFREYCARRAARSLMVSDDRLRAGVRAGGAIGIAGSIAAGSAFGSAVLRTCNRRPSGRAKAVVMRGRVRRALRIVVPLAVIPVWAIRVRRTWMAQVRRSPR